MLLERPYARHVSAVEVQERQGKFILVAGVTGVLLGIVLQAINVHSVATQPPPVFVSGAGGSAALVGTIAGFVVLGGVILAIVGIVRYAQSGSDGSSVIGPAPTQRTGAAKFCSSCGAGLTGEGRYCSSCGTPTAN
jgi:uncharacterized integral membrane protein